MSKVTMPETVGYQWLDIGHFRKKIPQGCDVSAFRALVTVDQAKSYAEARVREALAWRPIETAPKDGTEIWAFNREQGRMKWISGRGFALWVWVDDLLSDVDPSPDSPTHWMPLPGPPVE